jgi:hypothetical protein
VIRSVQTGSNKYKLLSALLKEVFSCESLEDTLTLDQKLSSFEVIKIFQKIIIDVVN